ncbi:unnamed protein product [Calypogeia fissa]
MDGADGVPGFLFHFQGFGLGRTKTIRKLKRAVTVPLRKGHPHGTVDLARVDVSSGGQRTMSAQGPSARLVKSPIPIASFVCRCCLPKIPRSPLDVDHPVLNPSQYGSPAARPGLGGSQISARESGELATGWSPATTVISGRLLKVIPNGGHECAGRHHGRPSSVGGDMT